MKLAAAVIVCLLAPSSLPAQSIIRVKDGDVILVENDDKVKVIRRRHANIRALYNADQRWVLVLADWIAGPQPADGRVDYTFTFNEVTGDWPLGPRWEGTAFIDQYDVAGAGPRGGMGVTTSAGLIQFLNSSPAGRTLTTDPTFADGSAVATLTFRGAGSAMSRDPFDVAEQRALARMADEAAGRPVTLGSGAMSATARLNVVGLPTPADYPPPTAPVRVGGNIAQPRKITHVEPVAPEAARQAGVRGMVILEIVIGADGRVQRANVLRGIPLLDQAALDAVKQWVYEPTHLNGAPIPVIMTVTVAF